MQTVWQPAFRGSVWSGNLTFPAQLRLKTYPDGVRVTRTPIDEITSLHTGALTVNDRMTTPATSVTPGGGDTFEVTAEFDAAGATATRFGVKVRDRTIAYDGAARTLYGAPAAPDNARILVRALADRGQLEVFGNNGALSVSDVVPFDPAALGVQAYAEGGDVRLVSLRLDLLDGEQVIDATDTAYTSGLLGLNAVAVT